MVEDGTRYRCCWEIPIESGVSGRNERGKEGTLTEGADVSCAPVVGELPAGGLDTLAGGDTLPGVLDTPTGELDTVGRASSVSDPEGTEIVVVAKDDVPALGTDIVCVTSDVGRILDSEEETLVAVSEEEEPVGAETMSLAVPDGKPGEVVSGDKEVVSCRLSQPMRVQVFRDGEKRWIGWSPRTVG